MNNNPVVSILMTVYNGMPYLTDSVSGILNQTYENIQLIIVDDGSTDGSLEYLKGMKDTRLIIVNGGRLGRGRALNLGLSHCQGKYIAINDADDISMKVRIEKQVEFLETHPDHVLVGSRSYLLDFVTKEKIAHTRPTNDADIRMALTRGQPIQHVCVLMKTETVLSVGGYNEEIRFLFDRDIFIRLAQHGKLANLDEVLVEVGHHSERFFYYRFKGYKRELLSLKYRIMAIRQFNFPKYFILREVFRSILSLLPGQFRKSLISLYKRIKN